MIKKYTKENEEAIIQLLSKLDNNNADQLYLENKLNNWIGEIKRLVASFWSSGNIITVGKYFKDSKKANSNARSKVKAIFFKVRMDDSKYGKSLNNIQSELFSPLKLHLDLLIKTMSPKGVIDLKATGAFLSFSSALLSSNIKNNYKYIVFQDDDLHFGGNQGACKDLWAKGERAQIRKIVKKHFPNMTDAQIGKLVKEMNSEGCFYTALSNSIFKKYIGREEEFEKKFGFPMYDKNGYPNYNLVLLDFYCEQGEINGVTSGLSIKTSEKRWEQYLHNKNIKVDVVNIDVDINQFESIEKKGEVIVAVRPMRLRDATGNLVDTRSGGHAMTITDVVVINGKKMYKLSSWGKDFYIDPTDYKGKNMSISYQQVRY